MDRETTGAETPADERPTKEHRTKFRFKSHKRSRNERDDDLDSHNTRRRGDHSDRSRSPRRHRHHHRRRRRDYDDRSHSNTHTASSYREPRDDEETTSDKYRDSVADALAQESYMSPDAAFRESLFDALADDEGANYWEDVYGQPIHVYGRDKQGPQGELEQMTDEEYAAYVRTRMFEKTHQHIFEERERQEEARKKRREEAKRSRKHEAEHENFQQRVEESLRKSEARRSKHNYKDAWKAYIAKWDAIRSDNRDTENAGEAAGRKPDLPWPVESGNMGDVSRENVESFMQHANTDLDLQALLKAERVRWHPDKIQQRFMSRGLDEDSLKVVTAVFQILDEMWISLKTK